MVYKQKRAMHSSTLNKQYLKTLEFRKLNKNNKIHS